MEYLESIPDSSICLKIGSYYAEILQVKDNKIRAVKMWEQPREETGAESQPGLSDDAAGSAGN
jgi:Mg2+/Co2+ transporter CorB